MMKHSESAYERDKIMYAFVGEHECIGEEICGTDTESLRNLYDSYRDSLCEIDCMIQYFQDIGDTDEVAIFRKMAMHTKMVMREIKRMIANTLKEEVVYS